MPTPRVWFHCIVSTYGSWLPGDPRGFRTRHHREHVEGDYKSPPAPGIYEDFHDANRQALSQARSTIPPSLRKIIGEALRDRLQKQGGDVLAIACSGQHLHVQVQLNDGDARKPLGYAKQSATSAAHQAGFAGKLWAVRGTVMRIRDRAHQERVYRYILEHAREGAWVWSALALQE